LWAFVGDQIFVIFQKETTGDQALIWQKALQGTREGKLLI
jgi:hypothetical protein